MYGVFDYQATKTDELSFQIGDRLTVLRKGDDTEKEWWWARLTGKEGYIPRNMLGVSFCGLLLYIMDLEFLGFYLLQS